MDNKKRVGLAKPFKQDPETVEQVGRARKSLPLITQMIKTYGPVIDKAAQSNREWKDSELARLIEQFNRSAGAQHQITNGLAFFEQLEDHHFNEMPYPECDEHWQIICRRFRTKLSEMGLGDGHAAMASYMENIARQIAGRVAEIERAVERQGLSRAPVWEPKPQKSESGVPVEEDFDPRVG